MARPLRLEFPGALYHVTSRGDGREAIFLDDSDRADLLSTLGSVVGRFNWRLHAYCLMGNHYHLLVETPEPNLARGMRQLNGVYTQRFNRGHGRVGHVFQGRYKAILVDRDAYLLELARYIVHNPVRARIHRKPERYAWSSYRASVGIKPVPEWLTVEWILAQFAQTRRVAMRCYAEFVQAGIGPPMCGPDCNNRFISATSTSSGGCKSTCPRAAIWRKSLACSAVRRRSRSRPTPRPTKTATPPWRRLTARGITRWRLLAATLAYTTAP